MGKFVIQIRFTKKGRARFLSHRELMTVLERAIRRAQIPVKMSEGFNPRPRLSFPTALPLGVESDDELMYLTLADWLSVGEIFKRLQQQLDGPAHQPGADDGATGLEILSAEPVLGKELPRVKGIEYLMSFQPPREAPTEEALNGLMSQPRILVERLRDDQIKTVDVRRFITALRRLDDRTVTLVVQYTPDGSVSPAEVLKSLGIKEGLAAPNIQVRKTRTLI